MNMGVNGSVCNTSCVQSTGLLHRSCTGVSTWYICLLSMAYKKGQYESNLGRQTLMLLVNQTRPSVGCIVVRGMEQAKHLNDGKSNHL